MARLGRIRTSPYASMAERRAELGFGTSKYWVMFLVAHCHGSGDWDDVAWKVLVGRKVVVTGAGEIFDVVRVATVEVCAVENGVSTSTGTKMVSSAGLSILEADVEIENKALEWRAIYVEEEL